MKNAYSVEFESWWSEYPSRGEAENNKKSAFRCYQATLRKDVTPEMLLDCVRGYAAAKKRDGSFGTRFVKQASVFLGPDEHWRLFVPKPRPAKVLDEPVEAKTGIPEERPDPAVGLAFVRNLIEGLAKAKGTPALSYVRNIK